jgi:hypothetical protein
MKKKPFFVVLICCVLVPVMVFGAYQFGSLNGYASGFSNGELSGVTSHTKEVQAQYIFGFTQGNQSGYVDGYAAGLAAQNVTVP